MLTVLKLLLDIKNKGAKKMGVENFRAELTAPYVGGRVGELSAKIGERLIRPKHSLPVQVLGAAMLDFADPKVSLFRSENWHNF